MQLLSGPDGKLHVYFFDVGQGDSTLIVTPKGRQILVDGGPDAESATRALAATLPRDDRSLDIVVLTHLDADHSRGLLRVLDHYVVGSVLVGVEYTESALYPQLARPAGTRRPNPDTSPRGAPHSFRAGFKLGGAESHRNAHRRLACRLEQQRRGTPGSFTAK